MSEHMQTRRKIMRPSMIVTVCMAMALAINTAQADEREEMETLRQTTLNLIQILVEQGVLTQEKADQLINQAEVKAGEAVAAEKKANIGVVRVPYVPESVKKQIADGLREEVTAKAKAERWGNVNAVPEWLDRLTWEGDMRVRYQGDLFPEGNAPEVYFQTLGQAVSNTTEDRHRARIRLNLGLNARVAPGVNVGVRMATGNTSDPVSTNQTLGTTANKYSLVLDRAFIKIAPLQSVSVSGGRIPNPWFGTDLVWDVDLNFEGVAVGFNPWANEVRAFKPFAVAGIFPLQEVEKNTNIKVKDKWLYGAQLGLDWIPGVHERFKVGVGYYDYRNVSGVPNPKLNDTQFNQTAPQSRQKGNSLFNIDNDGNVNTNLYALAPDYRIVNVTLAVGFAQFFPLHVIGNFDWARNVGFDQAEILTRTGQSIEPETEAYQAKLTVGYPEITDRHEWQVFTGYRYLERDAVLDAFTDSDFYLGGTNHKGFMIGGQYGIYKNTWLSMRWASMDEISGLPLSIDVFQLDLTAKF